MRQSNGPWVMVVGLVMVALGAAIVWSVFQPSTRILDRFDRLVLGLLMVCVGAYASAVELNREPEDTTPSLISAAVEPFIVAWSKLWRMKWLLWVYGSIAVIAVVGDAIVDFLAYRWVNLNQVAPQDGGALAGKLSPMVVANWLQYSLHGVYAKLVPMIPSFRGAPVYAIAVFFLAIWALSRVSRLSEEPEYQSKSKLVSICAVAAALSGIWVGALWLMMARWMWTAGSPSRVDQYRSIAVVSSVIGTVEMVILAAVVMGGVIGSILRSSRGERDVNSTFLLDAVKYFAPLAGIYLVIEGVFLVPGLTTTAVTGGLMTHSREIIYQGALVLQSLLQLACLSLIFAPLGAVAFGFGTKAAIVHSLDVWKGMWRQVAALVAVGASVIGLIRLLVYVPSLLYPNKGAWTNIPVGAVTAITGVFLSAYILLAVWEFYRANVIDRESASARV